MTKNANPLRVMHVVVGLQAGGVSYGIVEIANGLPRYGIASSICSMKPADPRLAEQLDPAVTLHECHRRDGNDPSLVWQLYRVFRKAQPHIVHTHAWGTLLEGLVAARLARVPILVHGEHGTLQSKPHQLLIQKRAWRSVHAVLSVSSRLAERMNVETGFPLRSIRVIRHGVDLQRFKAVDQAGARAALGLPASKLLIGSVGRLEPVKDHANLLTALAALAQEGVDFTGVIAGDGPLRPVLTEQARALGIADRVVFLGHRSDVERVFAAVDVFVLPSLAEGLSNTILEAMASGRPVVATDVGGAGESLDDGVTGLLVPPANPVRLATALRTLAVRADMRTRMGAEARRSAFTRFSRDRMLREYADLYTSLAPGHAVDHALDHRISSHAHGSRVAAI